MPGLTQKSDVTLKLNIDPSFTGILRGVDNGVAERTYLKGTLHVCAYKPVKVRKLAVRFEGRCKVTISTSNGTLVSAPEGVECRNLITKKTRYISSDPGDKFKILEKGNYSFPFEYELPPQLPASYSGKRGWIQYRLRASLHRSVFTNNVYDCRDITIRRCLYYDAIPLDSTEVVVGRDYPDEIEYSASAPTVVYREGGLVPLNLNVRLLDDDHTIRAITCALRERIICQTTGQQSLTCKSISQTDESFPLGWSTFYPAEEEHYDPRDKHEYNAQFRLCPRVQPDIKTRLIRVSHALIINITITDLEHEGEEKNKLTTPLLSRSSSASSLSSILSLGRQQASNTEELVKDVLTTLSSGSGKRHQTSNGHTHLCNLELPLVVTSRQHSWEGAMPHPPAYQNAETPPTYRQSIEHLPPAPNYRNYRH